MAQFNFLNYGQAVQQGQQIQASRMRMDEQKNILKNREMAKNIRLQYEEMPDQIAKLDEAGLFEEASSLRNQYIQQRMNETKVIASMRGSLDETNYKDWRQDMIQSGAVEPEMLPVEYSDPWFRKELEKKKGDLKKMTRKWQGDGAILSQDLISQDGEIIWEGEAYDGEKKPASKGASSGSKFGVKSGDSNTINRIAANIYEGMWDPETGQYSGLDKESRKKVLSISERASKIFRENQGAIPHIEAVAQSAREFGIPDIRQITESQQETNDDPLGLL